MLGEEVGQGALGTPVVGRVAHVADDDARKVNAIGLHVGGAHAVVANLRVGEGDDLAGVGGVGDDLLVAGHRGVEDELAERLAGGAHRQTLERGAVLERKQRLGGALCQKWVHAFPFRLGSRGKKKTPGVPERHKNRRPAWPRASPQDGCACAARPLAQRKPGMSSAESGRLPCRYPVPCLKVVGTITPCFDERQLTFGLATLHTCR